MNNKEDSELEEGSYNNNNTRDPFENLSEYDRSHNAPKMRSKDSAANEGGIGAETTGTASEGYWWPETPLEMPAVKKKRSWGNIVLRILGIILFLFGGALIYGHFMKPDLTEKIVYGAKTRIEGTVDQVRENVTGELPTIYLEGSGGMYELDIANPKTFVLMDAYGEVPGVIPMWAAHNGSGGSIVIPWEVGQKFNIEGSGKDGVWVVVDTMPADKFGTVDQALPLEGTIGLQTCFWGEPYVRFLGIVPLEVWEEGWPPEPQSGDSTPQSTENMPSVDLIVED